MNEELLKALQEPFRSIGVTGSALEKAVELVESEGYARPAIDQSSGESAYNFFVPFAGDSKSFVKTFTKKYHRQLWPSGGTERPSASQMLRMKTGYDNE